MNKFSLKEHLQAVLNSYASTFKETSYDEENKQHLCSDATTTNVYDFDAYIAASHDKSSLPASPDAIYLGQKHLYFVEFKNQLSRDIDKAQIQRKFCNGTKILKDMLEEFTPKDCCYHFCVVFKDTSKPRYFDSRHIENTAVRFGLQALNEQLGGFYDQVFTENLGFYVEKFTQLKC